MFLNDLIPQNCRNLWFLKRRNGPTNGPTDGPHLKIRPATKNFPNETITNKNTANYPSSKAKEMELIEKGK